MAKDDEKKPTAAEKGKGKALNGDADKAKDAKADAEDKKGAAATTGGMFTVRNSSYSRTWLMTSCRGAQ